MLPPEFESIANELISRFSEWTIEDEGGAELPDLLTAEEHVASFVRQLGLSMLQTFVDVRREQARAARAPCGCGERREVHRAPRWVHKTLRGPVVVTDIYTCCRECGSSDRPLHEWLGTDHETWSLAVQEAAVDLAADESCEKAVGKLERHHPGVEMGRTTALRLLHEHGARAREFINRKLTMAVSAAMDDSTLSARGCLMELEVEYDAGMIPVATLEPIEPKEGEEVQRTPVRGLPKRQKKCAWEEVKAGLVQVPGEATRLFILRPTSELEAVFEDLFGLACLKGWSETTQVRGIADGARYIRTQHLSDAGKALEPITGIPAQQWATAALFKLETGRADDVIAELRGGYERSRNDVLRLEANYFEHNADAVLYAEFRARGWSTASSEIESGHRNVVQIRLKIPGAWWHPDRVDHILALRILKANGWWDEYWASQRQQWSNRQEVRRGHGHGRITA